MATAVVVELRLAEAHLDARSRRCLLLIVIKQTEHRVVERERAHEALARNARTRVREAECRLVQIEQIHVVVSRAAQIVPQPAERGRNATNDQLLLLL